jgi:hypothetical protein
LLPNNRTVTIATVSGGYAVQAAHGFLVEVTKAFGLEPIREDAKQQVARQRLRRFAPEHAPPPRAQGRKIEIAQPRDLVFKLASIDHLRTAAHRARRADFFRACRAPIVTIR